mgnify:CR=1 FL=1
MNLIGGVSNAFSDVRILQSAADEETDGLLARTVYIALQRIGERRPRSV